MQVINEDLLAQFRGYGPCSLCGKMRHRDAHHATIRRGMGGGSRIDVPENVIALCRNCHQQAEDHPIVAQECRHRIAAREGVLHGTIDYWLRLILRTPKEGPMSERPWKISCEHVWGIDGQHSNEYCKKCFISRPTCKAEDYPHDGEF